MPKDCNGEELLPGDLVHVVRPAWNTNCDAIFGRGPFLIAASKIHPEVYTSITDLDGNLLVDDLSRGKNQAFFSAYCFRRQTFLSAARKVLREPRLDPDVERVAPSD